MDVEITLSKNYTEPFPNHGALLCNSPGGHSDTLFYRRFGFMGLLCSAAYLSPGPPLHDGRHTCAFAKGKSTNAIETEGIALIR